MSLKLNHSVRKYGKIRKSSNFGAWVATMSGVMVASFLALTLVPTYAPEKTFAESNSSEMSVNVADVLNMAISVWEPVIDPETGEETGGSYCVETQGHECSSLMSFNIRNG